MSARLFFLIMAALLGAACSSQPAMMSEPADRFTPLGRYVKQGDGYLMGWPGSGVVLTFKGKTLAVEITDDGAGLMDVFIDGVEQDPVRLTAGKHLYTLIDKSHAGNHNVRLTRRTEVFDTGLFTLHRFYHDGILRSAPRPPRKLLFLGDSITAGFGVRGPDAECPYSPETNAPWQTYAALTANAFEAEPHFIAISGRGVSYNWDANPMPVMTAQLDMTLPDHPEYGAWDQRDWRPDAVVVALGTNDWSTVPRGPDWAMDYAAMLAQIRGHYPSAPIFIVDGPLLTPERNAQAVAAMRQAVATRNTAGDTNIYRVSVSLTEQGEAFSCNYHPSALSNQHMARQLIAAMSPVTGWAPRE